MAAPPALRVGRAARPAPSHHKGCSAIRAQKTSPWPRPASTATGSGLFRFAMTAVAGPLPVLFPECAKQALTTSDAANRSVKHRFFGGRRPRPGGLIPLERAACKRTLRSQNRNTETIGPADQEGLDQRKRKPERRKEREQHAHRREHPLDPVRGIRDSILQRDLVPPSGTCAISTQRFSQFTLGDGASFAVGISDIASRNFGSGLFGSAGPR